VAEKVGELYYDITLDTAKMIDGQRKVDGALRKTTGSLDAFEARLSQITAAIKIYATALAVIKSAKLADDMRLLASRVQVAAGSFDSGTVAMQRLIAISRETQTTVEANAAVFARLNQSILQMGGTQNDTLRLTELLAKAIRVSGASAVEAKSAMLQFGQALGSGKLAGDELRSLLENAPYLMRQLADGLGVPIGALKQLGEDGKLTADVVMAALGKAATQIEADFAKFPQTVGGAFDVAVDAALRANEKFDQLTGTSTALTGVTKGLGEVLDKLADQFGAANDEAGTLSRNEKIKSWADSTKVVLSYVVDAADFIVRGFKQIGIGLGGLAASAGAVMEGNFSGARTILSSLLDDIKAVNRDPLAGKQLRDLWNAGAGGGRGFINPAPAASTLKAPPGAGGGGKPKKSAAEKFDSEAYLAELRKAQATEMGVINETEAEKLRVAKKNLDEKKISEQTYVQAVLLITEAAEKDRAELMRKTQEGIDRERLEAERRAVRERAEIERNRQDARRDIAFDDPLEQIRIEEEARLAIVEQARQQDLANEQLYQDQKLAIQRWAAEQREQVRQQEADRQQRAQEMQLSAMADLAGNVYALLQKTGQEQSALGKAAFLAQKAITVAQIIMSTNAAAAAALAPPPLGLGPVAGIGLATVIKATGYASAGLVAGMAIGEVAGGRQYGGPASAGSLYRVNETGRPEMFTASNGNQYMLPTKSGRVTPADQVGGTVQWTINVHNAPPGTSVAVDQQARTIEIAVARAVGEVASQISSNTGQVATALRSTTNVRPRL